MIFDGDRHELGKYIREIADIMGLRDWHVDLRIAPLKTDEPDDDSVPLAEIQCAFGRRYAHVTFVPGWENGDPEMVRMVVCHELVHAHLSLMGWITNNVHDALGNVAFSVFRASYHDAEELAVDAIATAWAETLPLPVKAKKPRKKQEAA